MRTCFIVAVDYPVVEQTIKYNRHHFDQVRIITSIYDKSTQQIAGDLGVHVYVTDAFYKNGAYFNKWLALEEGLDYFGRSDWLWIMDADIFLPKCLTIDPIIGNLYTPHRRMGKVFKLESEWQDLPEAPNTRDFNGYCHIFHSSDWHLPTPPWYQTDWLHAGGADTFFQRNWEPIYKIRPSFEVLHVGPTGTNWCGVGNFDTLRKLRSIRHPEYYHERIHLPTDPRPSDPC